MRIHDVNTRAIQTAMTIRILAVGGTFDKHYDPIAGEMGFAASHVPEAAARARITPMPVIEELALLDSLDMRDADRQAVLDACRRASEMRILIVHGTDTMRETAQVLGKAKLGKTVVLTGAMIPYEVRNSDALFNFGFAFGLVQALQEGVYVGMNGRICTWDNVAKDRAAGIFDETQ